MTQSDHSVRAMMAAAARRIRRLKRVDRAAVVVITLGGLAVVVSVLGILLFIAAEAVPLFRAARVLPAAPIAITTAVTGQTRGLRAIGVDEYRRYLYTIEPDARVVFRHLADGTIALEVPVPGLEPAPWSPRPRPACSAGTSLRHD